MNKQQNGLNERFDEKPGETNISTIGNDIEKLRECSVSSGAVRESFQNPRDHYSVWATVQHGYLHHG